MYAVCVARKLNDNADVDAQLNALFASLPGAVEQPAIEPPSAVPALLIHPAILDRVVAEFRDLAAYDSEDAGDGR